MLKPKTKCCTTTINTSVFTIYNDFVVKNMFKKFCKIDK